MDIYNELYESFKIYLKTKSIYNPTISKKVPQNISTFPLVVFKETNNISTTIGKTTNYQEFIDLITLTTEIYTKNKVINGVNVASDVIMNEIKSLAFNFMKNCGFNRLSSTPVPFIDLSIDRLVTIHSCKVNNWNKKII